jgi:hypothetical protein
MVVIGRGSEWIVGEGSESVPNLDMVWVSFEDEGDGDRRALSQVEDGGLAAACVGVGGGSDNVEDVVIGRTCLKPLGVVRVERGGEGGSSSGHGG